MCDVVVIDGNAVETIRELRAAIPLAEVKKAKRYKAIPPDDSCLCGVDVEATLRQAGRDFEYDPIFGRWKVWSPFRPES
jgi:hypothetical protein